MPTSIGSSKKQEFQKNIYFCFTDYDKAFDCVNLNKLRKILRDGNSRPLDVPPEKSMQVKKQQLELEYGTIDLFQIRKEYIRDVYCHLAYLTYMQSTLCEMLSWMKHKLESRDPGEISITLDMQMTPPLWQETKKK